MADYRLVDIEQLESDLTSVADGIRSKSGGTSDLAFPDGFKSEVDNIQVGGGDNSVLFSLIDRSITEFNNNQITEIGNYAFNSCNNLHTVRLPSVDMVSICAFQGCVNLTFVELAKVTYIGNYSFGTCNKLTTFIIRATRKCYLSQSTAFTNTPIANGTGYIYVPSSLVDAYKSDAKWLTYADQIRAIEDYPEITGG